MDVLARQVHCAALAVFLPESTCVRVVFASRHLRALESQNVVVRSSTTEFVHGAAASSL